MSRGMKAWARAIRWMAFLFVACIATARAESLLYAATVREHPGMSATDTAGTLYLVDPTTGASKAVGPLKLAGQPIGITGLAVHPKTGVFFGVTAGSSINHPRTLVTVDPNTAEATLVGEMRVSGSDISFSPDGTLYVWLPDTNQLGRINLSSGRVTPVGEIGETTRIEGGIAFDGHGHLFATPAGATGPLELRDPETGAVVGGPMIANAPYLSSLNSLAFSPEGELYAVNSNMGTPAHTALVKLDTKTGVATQVGVLPEDTDCITFADAPRPSLLGRYSTGTLIIAGSGAIGLLLLAGVALRRRRVPRAASSPAA